MVTPPWLDFQSLVYYHGVNHVERRGFTLQPMMERKCGGITSEGEIPRSLFSRRACQATITGSAGEEDGSRRIQENFY